jgi:hypothetical protein
MPSQQGFRCDDGGHVSQNLPSQPFGLGGQSAALVVVEFGAAITELFP